jgi:two-component system sensor histidine kinase EvgS
VPAHSADSASPQQQHGAPMAEPQTQTIIRPPVDHSVLAGLTGGNTGIEQAVLANFRRVNGEDVAMLERAVDEQSIAKVTRSAHRMKGACRMIGAHALAAVAEVIEHASRNEDWPAVRSNMATFATERDRLDGWVDGLLVATRRTEPSGAIEISAGADSRS